MDRRASILNLSFKIAIVLNVVFMTTPIHSADNPSPEIRRLTVLIKGASLGSGFIIGDDADSFYVVTASHVAGILGDVKVLSQRGRGPNSVDSNKTLTCHILVSEAKTLEELRQPPESDLALVQCPKTKKMRFFFDVVGQVSELTPGAHLKLIRQLGSNEDVPLGYFDVPLGDFLLARWLPDSKPIATIEYYDPLKRDLSGASGGPLLTDRSEFIGITFEDSRVPDFTARAYEWKGVRAWIEQKEYARHIRLTRRSRSASAVPTRGVELALDTSSLYVPNYGWFHPSPRIRASALLPNLQSVGVSFDFTYYQSTKGMGLQKLSMFMPSMMAEWKLGNALGPLRRREPLGGLYLAAGIAPVSLQSDRLILTHEQANIRSWTTICDAGWRYRLPGKAWGFTASYREGILLDKSAQALYPRFRAIGVGLFTVFR